MASELPYLFLIFLENEDSCAITLYFFVRNHLFPILLTLLQIVQLQSRTCSPKQLS